MLLEVSGVDAGYGQVQVLRELSLSVREGERVALFGPNGHGKSTLLRLVSGLLRPWSGMVEFDGEAIHTARPKRIVEKGVVHVLQGSTLFPRLTVHENLMLGAYCDRCWNDRDNSLEQVLQLFPRLDDRRGQVARTLSGGERQMLAVGMGLMARPRLLILDEPTLGLAPKVKAELAATVRQVAESGVSLIVVDQDLELLRQVTDRLCLVERGTVTQEIASDAAISESDLLDAYFGGHSHVN